MYALFYLRMTLSGKNLFPRLNVPLAQQKYHKEPVCMYIVSKS